MSADETRATRTATSLRVERFVFLDIDPIEKGSANNYDYVNGDPVNGLDLDGTLGQDPCGAYRANYHGTGNKGNKSKYNACLRRLQRSRSSGGLSLNDLNTRFNAWLRRAVCGTARVFSVADPHTWPFSVSVSGIIRAMKRAATGMGEAKANLELLTKRAGAITAAATVVDLVCQAQGS